MDSINKSQDDAKSSCRSPRPRAKEQAHQSLKKAANDWRRRADELADWTNRHLVNRDDAYGQYLSLNVRTAKQTAVTQRQPVTHDLLRRHFRGEDVGDLIGLHTTSADNRCRWGAVDIDQHGEYDDASHRRNRAAAITLYEQLRSWGFDPLLISSNGRGGYHLLVIFEKSLPSEMVYRFIRWLVRVWEDLGLSEEPETFPRQPKLTEKCKLGNWLRLSGRHHTLDHYSKVWDGKRWLSGDEAVGAILATEGRSARNIPMDAFCYDLPELRPKPAPLQTTAKPDLTQKQSRSPIGTVLRLLKNVRQSGDQWSARCPAHADHDNSLSVTATDEGKVLIYCHTGCDLEEILEAIGLSTSHLFPPGIPKFRKKPKLTRRYRTRRPRQ